MQYILTAGWEDGVADLAQRLVHDLAANKRVLWLVSGGSNIRASVQVMQTISRQHSRNLTILPADERYGEPGHADSNWAQLLKAGFDSAEATVLSVLQAGLSLAETVARYNQLAVQAFADNQVVIAQLGIGEDGHIAGIMLGSEVARDDGVAVVAIVKDPPLIRMTLTFAGLRQVTAAYVFAFGAPKRRILTSLESEPLPLNEQPAQILKQLPEAYVYSDQAGEHV